MSDKERIELFSSVIFLHHSIERSLNQRNAIRNSENILQTLIGFELDNMFLYRYRRDVALVQHVANIISQDDNISLELRLHIADVYSSFSKTAEKINIAIPEKLSSLMDTILSKENNEFDEILEKVRIFSKKHVSEMNQFSGDYLEKYVELLDDYRDEDKFYVANKLLRDYREGVNEIEILSLENEIYGLESMISAQDHSNAIRWIRDNLHYSMRFSINEYLREFDDRYESMLERKMLDSTQMIMHFFGIRPNDGDAIVGIDVVAAELWFSKKSNMEKIKILNETDSISQYDFSSLEMNAKYLLHKAIYMIERNPLSAKKMLIALKERFEEKDTHIQRIICDNIGVCCRELGLFKEAKEWFGQALEWATKIKDFNSRDHYAFVERKNIAEAEHYIDEKKSKTLFDELVRDYKKTSKNRPRKPKEKRGNKLSNLASAFRRTGQYAQELKYRKQMFDFRELGADDSDGHRLCLLLEGSSDNFEKIKELDREKKITEVKGLFHRAAVAFRYDDALVFAKKYIQFSETTYGLFTHGGVFILPFLLNIGFMPDDELELLIRQSSNNLKVPAALDFLKVIYLYENEKKSEACDLLEKTMHLLIDEYIEIDPESIEELMTILTCYRTPNIEMIKEFIPHIVKIHEKAGYVLSKKLASLNQPDLAIIVARETIGVLGDKHELSMDLMLNVAEILLQMGDFEGSIHTFEDLTRIDPELSECYKCEMARVHAASGNIQKAKKLLLELENPILKDRCREFLGKIDVVNENMINFEKMDDENVASVLKTGENLFFYFVFTEKDDASPIITQLGKGLELLVDRALRTPLKESVNEVKAEDSTLKLFMRKYPIRMITGKNSISLGKWEHVSKELKKLNSSYPEIMAKVVIPQNMPAIVEICESVPEYHNEAKHRKVVAFDEAISQRQKFISSINKVIDILNKNYQE